MSKMGRIINCIILSCFVLSMMCVPAFSADKSGKTVKVFVLAGQSNMEGKSKVSLWDHQAKDPKTKDFFAHLRDGDDWVKRDDVFIKYLERKGKLTVGYGSRSCCGSEFEFGNVMGEHFKEPVLLIKAAWGGHSLYQKFRSPSAGLPAKEILDAELKQAQDRVKKDNEKRKQNKPLPTMDEIKARYGVSYRAMMKEVKDVMDNYQEMFPELKGKKLDITGFYWFQGFNDQFGAHAPDEYESNMKHFIKDVRKDLGKPKLPFVIATMGTWGWDGAESPKEGSGTAKVVNAQMAMNNVPEFKGNVKAFQTAPLHDEQAAKVYPNWRKDFEGWQKVGSDRPYHYLGSAIWYTRIGRQAGEEMLKLMGIKSQNPKMKMTD